MLVVLILLSGADSKAMQENCDPKARNISFTELKELYQNEEPNQCLGQKLFKTLNLAYTIQPIEKTELKHNSKLKKDFFRVAHWNIERGLNVEAIKKLFAKPNEYLSTEINHERYKDKSEKLSKLKEQIEHLKDSDVILLNEVDWGMSRTEYKNIVKEIANAVGGGYIYGTEFLEIDPQFLEDKNTNPELYQGLHGNAIITKFPINTAWVIKLPSFYDWYKTEKDNNKGEVRRGRRMALVAQLILPNKEKIHVVTSHFEDRTSPENRSKQMIRLLHEMRFLDTAVILGGDFNNFVFDTSEIEEIKKKGKIFGPFFNPNDPTSPSIPFIAPNDARSLFEEVEKYEFVDGGHFDLAGDNKLSFSSKGKFSNSNERNKKGFVETLKHFGSKQTTKYKIDWLFVKPKVSKDKEYFPAFGRTLKELNYSYKDTRISDHSPITVDIMI